MGNLFFLSWLGEFGQQELIKLGGNLLLALVLLVLWRITLRFGFFLIDRFLSVKEGKKNKKDPRHIRTLNRLLKSMLTYVLLFVLGTMFLSLLGIPIASILAGAGILGLAIGFGAQSLVKDFISGFFILFENQYAVGDMVKAGSAEGIVEEIGLRTTVIKAFSGEFFIIPNGKIDTVVNYSRGSMRVRVVVSIAYEENINEALAVLQNVCDQVTKEYDGVADPPKPLGVSDLGESGIDIMIVGRAQPMMQWGLERMLRKRIKEAFDEAGIEIPYPKRVIYTPKVKREKAE